MLRIRTVKPEFFASADIAALTPLARLFYAYLWCEADREGRIEWNEENFELRFFQRDNPDIAALARELTTPRKEGKKPLLVIYEVDGETYAYIPTFSKHQVINNRERESDLPPPEIDASFTRAHASQGKEGREGKGRKNVGEKKFSDVDFELVDFFYSCLSTVNPGHREPVRESWANDFRLMRERDNRQPEAIRGMIQWVINNSFWRANVLCPSKLREKWDQLEMQRNRGGPKPPEYAAGAL